MSKLKPALDVEGELLFANGIFIAPVFRIYHEDKTFTDYKIYHYDMEIKIKDKFAVMLNEDDDPCIDYNFLNKEVDGETREDKEKTVNKRIEKWRKLITDENREEIKKLIMRSYQSLNHLYTNEMNRINRLFSDDLSFAVVGEIFDDLNQKSQEYLENTHKFQDQIKDLIDKDGE